MRITYYTKDLDQGEGLSPELHSAMDLALRATKMTTHAIGSSMAAIIATEMHLWLYLSGIKEKDKTFLLDAPVWPSELNGTTVEMVVEKFRGVRQRWLQ